MTQMTKPMVMGLLMGPMMLMMLHTQLMGDTPLRVGPAIIFVGAHVAFVAVILFVSIFAARLSPRVRGWIDRLHRPNLRHIGAMLIGAVMSAGLVHLFMHGVV